MITELLLGVEAGGKLLSSYSRMKGAQTQALENDIRKTQESMRAIQKTEKAQVKELQTMSKQAVAESQSGFSAASPTYSAIAQSSFNAFLHDEDMIALNESFQENMLDARSSAAQRNANQSIFTSLTNFSIRALNSYPVTSKTKPSDSRG